MTFYEFERMETNRLNGELQVILHLSTPSENDNVDTEFSTEFVALEKNLKERAIQFIKKQMPNLKIATIVIATGTAVLASFPLKKAEAHEVDFNMSYLYFGNTQSYISQVDKTEGNLNVVSPSYFDLNKDGTLNITSQFDQQFVKEMHNRGIKVVPFLSNHWDRNLGRSALANREKLATQIADFIIKNNLDGVQVDIENVTDIDRENYTDLVRLLHEKLPGEKEVSVAVAANPNGWSKGWHGSYDYKELTKYSDYLMIMAYDESYTGSPEGPVASYGWVERSIQYALNQGVPSEKIVLGIPFYGRYWKVGESSGGAGISNKRVDELLTKYGGTVKFDEKTKSPLATITIKEGDSPTSIAGQTLTPGIYHIWFENHDSIKAKLELLHKYELKGTGSWSLGQENTSIWQHYRTWLSHDGQVTVIPTNPSEPKEEAGEVAPVTLSTYTVKSGDSLWKIAAEHNMSINQIQGINNLKTDVIYVGQVLKVNKTFSKEDQQVSKETSASVQDAASAPAQKAPVVSPTIIPKPSPNITPAPQVKKITSLQFGSKGSEVIDLQNKLIKIGLYKGKSHGTYDTATKNAVIAFQKKYKLKADGIASTLTLNKLNGVIKVAPKSKVSTSVIKKYPTLRMNSKGSAVVDLQNKLRTTRLYKGKSHGSFDLSTKKAVIAFQKKYKLKADGIAGPTTLSKLDSVTKITPKSVAKPKTYSLLKAGARGTAVTDLQNRLKKLGMYKAKTSGIYDNATKKAVISFQKKYKLKADGMAGSATRSKLDALT